MKKNIGIREYTVDFEIPFPLHGFCCVFFKKVGFDQMQIFHISCIVKKGNN